MIRKSLSRTKGKRSKVKRSRYTGHLEWKEIEEIETRKEV